MKNNPDIIVFRKKAKSLQVVFLLFSRIGFSLFLLIPGLSSSQNWLYIASAPAKWVNIGDLDVSGDQLTVEALITRIPGGSTLNILSKHTDPGNANYLFRPEAFGVTTSTGFWDIFNPLSPLAYNTAFHVAVTYNGNELRYYVNGCLVNTAPCSGTMVLNDLNAAIGNQSTNQNEPFTGYLDEVRIWNVARTQAEIQANMNDLPNPTSQAGLMAYYKFESNYINVQGNALWNGTVVGSPVLTTNPYWSGAINNLSVSASSVDNICYNGSAGTITASASGAFTPYTFSLDGINYQASPSFAGLGSGTYTVYAQTNASCIDTTTIFISQPTQIAIAATQSFSPCDSFVSATASASGGTGSSYSFVWNTSPVQSGSTATGLSAGTYTIFATDSNNCTDSAFFSPLITPPLELAFSVLAPPCPGECNGSVQANASGGTAPYSFVWDNGQTSAIASGLCTGTFNITVTDTNNCAFSDTAVLLQALPISATLSSTNSNCGQPDGTASVTGSTGGGMPGIYSFQWDAAAGNQTSASATGLINGTYDVTISSGLCDTVVSISVGYNTPPTATATGDSTLCFEQCNGTGLITASGGPAPSTFVYLWDNGENTASATGLCAGVHTVTVTDSTGCSASASVTIEQPELLISTIAGDGDTSICTSGSVTVSASATGGTMPYSFLWNNGWNTSGPNTDNPSDSTCYFLTVTDAKGCDTISSLYCVKIYPPISVTSMSDDTICEGNSVAIGAAATGGHPDSTIIFTWDMGIQDDTITVSPSTYPGPETYYVIASDGCSPNDSGQVTIGFYITPEVSFSSDTASGCMPLTINFENTTPGIISSQWNFGDGSLSSSQDPVHVYGDTGYYSVSLFVYSSDSCPGDTTYYNFIRVNPLPPADAGNDTTVYQESTIQLSASGGVDYTWDTGENVQTISVTPANTSTYYVTVTDAKGCKSFGEVTVTVDFRYVIFVPSMFSPNNDGNNDFLFVQGKGIAGFNLKVFNRWGEMMFETSDEISGWDGKYKGIELNTGVYVYLLQANLDNGEVINRGGNITLVR